MDKKDHTTIEQFLTNFTLELIALDTKDNDKVYYKLQMELKDKKIKWQIEKRFSDFEALHLDLSKTTIEVPYLPPKSLFKLQQQDLQKRKNDLQKYLKSLVARPDILQNEIFQEFLELLYEFKQYDYWLKYQLNKYAIIPKEISYRMLGSISGFSMKVRDLHYEESQGIVFVLIGDNDLKTKVGGFLSSLLGSSKKGDPVGRLICLRAKNQYTFDFTKLWHIDFYSHPQVLHFCPKLTMVAVGLYNGDIEIYRVQVEKNYQNYEDVINFTSIFNNESLIRSYCVIKRHTGAITAIHLDFQNALCYSTSRDKAFLVTNISSNDTHYRIDEKILVHPLTALCVDTPNERVFLGDSVGTIYVYSTTILYKTLNYKKEPIQIITTLKLEYDNQINTIHITKQKNFVLVGHASGLIRVFELKKKGSDRVINPISAIAGAEGVIFQKINGHLNLSFSLKDKEIYTNCQWNILILNSAHNLPIISINAHKDQITKFQYVEERQIFVTGSKDFTVKFWKLRGSTDDKESEFEQLYHMSNQNKHQQKQVADLQAEIKKGAINPIEESRQKQLEKEKKEKKEKELEQKKWEEQQKKLQEQKQQAKESSDEEQDEQEDDGDNIFGWDK